MTLAGWQKEKLPPSMREKTKPFHKYRLCKKMTIIMVASAFC